MTKRKRKLYGRGMIRAEHPKLWPGLKAILAEWPDNYWGDREEVALAFGKTPEQLHYARRREVHEDLMRYGYSPRGLRPFDPKARWLPEPWVAP